MGSFRRLVLFLENFSGNCYWMRWSENEGQFFPKLLLDNRIIGELDLVALLLLCSCTQDHISLAKVELLTVLRNFSSAACLAFLMASFVSLSAVLKFSAKKSVRNLFRLFLLFVRRLRCFRLFLMAIATSLFHHGTYFRGKVPFVRGNGGCGCF